MLDLSDAIAAICFLIVSPNRQSQILQGPHQKRSSRHTCHLIYQDYTCLYMSSGKNRDTWEHNDSLHTQTDILASFSLTPPSSISPLQHAQCFLRSPRQTQLQLKVYNIPNTMICILPTGIAPGYPEFFSRASHAFFRWTDRIQTALAEWLLLVCVQCCVCMCIFEERTWRVCVFVCVLQEGWSL